MNFSRFFTLLGYVCGTAAVVIATGGVAAPAWLAATLTGVSTISAHLANSPVPQTPQDKK